MKFRNYFSLQLVVLGILAIMLIPKKVSSCSPFKIAAKNNKTEVEVVVAKTNGSDLKDELLLRY